jgi:hypothetical protein
MEIRRLRMKSYRNAANPGLSRTNASIGRVFRPRFRSELRF